MTRLVDDELLGRILRGARSSRSRGRFVNELCRRCLEIPDFIGLLSLRQLGPVIGQLRQRHNLNILGVEAVTAAVVLQVDVHLSASSPRLEEALRAERREVVILS